MIILGIDPGPAECGWMSIENDEDAPARSGPWHAHNCGKVASRHVAISKLLAEIRPNVVALERPKWQDHGRNPLATRAIASNLIETNYVVGRIASMVRASDRSLLEIPAQTWRLGLLSVRAPSDAQIKRAVQALLEGLPTQTNAHERDAGGVALAAARLIERRQENQYASDF